MMDVYKYITDVFLPVFRAAVFLLQSGVCTPRKTHQRGYVQGYEDHIRASNIYPKVSDQSLFIDLWAYMLLLTSKYILQSACLLKYFL